MVSDQIFRKTFSLHNKTTQTFVACEESQKRCWCFTVLFLISYQNHVLPSHKQTAELQQSKKKTPNNLAFFPPPLPTSSRLSNMSDACVNMDCTVLSCTCTAHARGWMRNVRRRKSFLIFLQTLPLKKKKRNPSVPPPPPINHFHLF